ncbi:glycosyltransferase family 4 protein [uncultured Acinetobacter sp.]|uniref:glycosyltransferase family 4 protein n=1 Tax=uncultured Acinetobacter sp. TaxID=165433 RepID=UPI0025D6B9C0|nr:glycosyltransferase family 4 protein [uncultured Acinetobacter sp.]
MYKVLFLVNSLTHKAGTERVVCVLANSMIKELNYSVSILNRDTNRANVAFDLDANVYIEPLVGNYLQFKSKIQKYINRENPDIIIVHNMGRLSLLCSFLKVPVGTKFISLEHVAYESRPNWVRFLYKYRSKKFNKIITLTNYDALAYLKFHHDVITIPNISPFDVEYNGSNYSHASKKIISIGRLTYQKNFQSLLLAWGLVQNKCKDWSLIIYGAGEDQYQLETMIKEMNLVSVELKGPVNDIASIYKAASFYVMSSRFEGLPMVLIEAQSFGLPIVSYDCPHGPADVIVHNENGFLVEDQNFHKLAENMLVLINDKEKRYNMSAMAKKNAKKFSQKNILKSWENLVIE